LGRAVETLRELLDENLAAVYGEKWPVRLAHS
jgi:hypothetical protein